MLWSPLDDVPVTLRAEAARCGVNDAELARRVRSGQLVRMRRGAYAARTDLTGLDRSSLHRLEILSTWSALNEPAVVSHGSAAVLQDLPLHDVPLDRVTLTRPPPANSRRRPAVHVLVANLRYDDVVELGPLQVTAPARTALDVARRHGMSAGVVAADHVLRTGAARPDELATCSDAMHGTPGSRNARRVAAFADGRSESVGESLSRLVMAEHGLPTPELQVPILDRSGTMLARTDFGYPVPRVVGEFDGRIKYSRLLRTGESPGDAVFREKRREDAVRGEGWDMVRWTWAEILRPMAMIDRWERALLRAERRRWL